MVFCVWLFSLSIMYSWSYMLQQVSVLPSFLWLNNSPLYECTTFCLSIHASVDIWGCFPLLVTVNSAAMNIHVQVFV